MPANEILANTIQKIDGAYAPSSIRAYKANFERYISFCDSISESALPSASETVAKYIQKLTANNLKSASIRLATAAISTIHKLNELPDPTQQPAAKLELRRMHRSLGRTSKQALGITAQIMEKMILATKNDLHGLRDKALILLAYDSLCRRSELVSIRLDDVECDDTGMPTHIQLRKSKTDQEAIGRVIRISSSTQESIANWIKCLKDKDGFLFRGVGNHGGITVKLSSGQINRIYKKLAKLANIPKNQIKNISGHSIRVGATQDLLLSGASLPILMNKGRWTKPDTAMRYAENAGLSSALRLFEH
jgi:integrase